LKKLLTVFCFAVMMVAASQVATATIIKYDFTIDKCTGGCGTPPFGSVTLDDFDASGDVAVSVSLSTGYKFVQTGFPGAFGFSLIGNPTIAVSGVSPSWSLGSVTAGTNQFDGFGDLDYFMIKDGKQGAGGAVFGPLEFHVLATGITVSSFAELSTGSTKSYFVADLLAPNGFTGPVGTGISVPDGGATAALLGLALVGLGFVRRLKG
jgi:hypothetical protein